MNFRVHRIAVWDKCAMKTFRWWISKRYMHLFGLAHLNSCINTLENIILTRLRSFISQETAICAKATDPISITAAMLMLNSQSSHKCECGLGPDTWASARTCHMVNVNSSHTKLRLNSIELSWLFYNYYTCQQFNWHSINRWLWKCTSASKGLHDTEDWNNREWRATARVQAGINSLLTWSRSTWFISRVMSQHQWCICSFTYYLNIRKSIGENESL